MRLVEVSRCGLGSRTSCQPQSTGSSQTRSPRGEREFAVGDGELGELVLGNMEEGVERQVSDALAQGGRLDKGGHPHGLGGAPDAEQQHLQVSLHRLEALLYRGEGSEVPSRLVKSVISLSFGFNSQYAYQYYLLDPRMPFATCGELTVRNSANYSLPVCGTLLLVLTSLTVD